MFTLFKAASANAKTLKALQDLDAKVGSSFAETITQEKEIWGESVALVVKKMAHPIEAAAAYATIYLLKNSDSPLNSQSVKINLSATISAMHMKGEFRDHPYQIFLDNMKEIGIEDSPHS